MQKNKIGTVILAGAGTSKGLITLDGLKAVKDADIIVYDDLIDPDLLSENPKAKKIYAGKRLGSHSAEQDDINKILLKSALEGNTVVRLKGGDSFVFGRGGEEADFLKKNSIPFRVIPGVTSAVAAPEHFGIPLTHRGVARSFTVITGHTCSGETEDYDTFARLKGTLVFLMGLSRLSEICNGLINAGKDKNTPACVISKAFYNDESIVRGTLETLTGKAVKANVKAPAIIVIGKTAVFNFKTDFPSVSVVGTKEFCEKFALKYPNVKAYANIKIIPEKTLPDYSDCDIIAFTSGAGVRLFFDKIKDIRTFSRFKFACVGPSTARALENYKIKADFIPSRFDKSTMLREMPPGKALVLGSGNLYRIESVKLDYDIKSDFIVFSSKGSVKSFFDGGGKINKALPVCIGNSTAAELKKYTQKFLIAKNHTIQGITEVILNEAFQKAQNK